MTNGAHKITEDDGFHISPCDGVSLPTIVLLLRCSIVLYVEALIKFLTRMRWKRRRSERQRTCTISSWRSRKILLLLE
jgi:hypothetical protein